MADSIDALYKKLEMLHEMGFEEVTPNPKQAQVLDCMNRLMIGGYPITQINTTELPRSGRIYSVFAMGEGKERIVGHGGTILACFQDALRQARERWLHEHQDA